MQRTINILLGLAVVAIVVALAVKGFTPPPKTPGSGAAAERSGDGGAAIIAVNTDAGLLDGGPLLLSELAPPLGIEGHADGGPYAKLPDGTPVPPLPPNAPKTVRFGVVLVTFTGAQPGAMGEKPNGRSKADAKELADRLAAEAKNDFHGAVQRGDPGSQDDVGKIRLGFLEPATEYVLFTINVNDVAGPIETPRGFWVVKRLE